MTGGDIATIIGAVIAGVGSIVGMIAGGWKAFQAMRARDRAQAEAAAREKLLKEQTEATIKALTEDNADLQAKYDALWSLLEGLTS